jgi:CHAT domain-containing protein/tetratricopeptide (TPR) repeat protein
VRRLMSIAIRCGAALLTAAVTVAQTAPRTDVDQARERYDLGMVESARGQYDAARADLVAALQIFERLKAEPLIGAAASALARLEYGLGNDRESRRHYERAIAAFEAAGDRRARARATLGLLVASSSDDATDRERDYNDLLADARTSRDPAFEAAVLHSWGDRLFSKGEYERASEKLEAAAIIAQRENDRDLLASIYTSLGRLYRVHAQPRAAVTYQLKALQLSKTSASPRLRVQSLNAVGVAYEASGDFTKAREYYERALAAAEEVGSPAILDFLRAQLGGLLARVGDAEPARVLLEGVLARGLEEHRSTRYGQLSIAYRLLGRFEDARAAATRALDSCQQDTLDCVYGHLRIVDAELALGHDAAALAEEDVALKTIEDLHSKLVATDFLKQEFHHFWEPAYSVGISLHFRRNEFREALETAELARARGFVDLLASHEIGVDSSLSREFPVLSTRGGQAMTIRSERAVDAPNADALAATAARLKSTIVEYWVANDAVYIWTVGPTGGVHGASVKIVAAKLDQLVRSTVPFARQVEPHVESSAIRSRGDVPVQIAARTNHIWRELYDLLVSPIERDLPRAAGARLTIVAHGPLLHVPFAALRDPQGRYLLERYTIHSVPAAAVLQFTNERRQVNARAGRLLLVADPAMPPAVSGEPPLPRLPGALEETRAIARLVPASRTTMLAEADATEVHVRSALATRAVVHFATHAIVRDADPMASFLALDRSKDRDGRLTARKIYGMQLDADLVVLSACRSGDGMVTGDGIAGLARAFFYAGAASVLVSVWDVADAPTSRLIPAFYRLWLSGADKARALRAAQLDLISDLRAGRVRVNTPLGEIAVPEDPAFWAGFALLGEPD